MKREREGERFKGGEGEIFKWFENGWRMVMRMVVRIVLIMVMISCVKGLRKVVRMDAIMVMISCMKCLRMVVRMVVIMVMRIVVGMVVRMFVS